MLLVYINNFILALRLHYMSVADVNVVGFFCSDGGVLLSVLFSAMLHFRGDQLWSAFPFPT